MNVKDEKQRKTEPILKLPLATTTLIFGALSAVLLGFMSLGLMYMLFLFTVVPAFITGFLALNRMRREPESYGGAWRAACGLALGLVGLAFFLSNIYFSP